MTVRAVDTVLFDLDDTLHDDTTAYRTAARDVAQAVARAHPVDAEALFVAYEGAVMAFWTALTADHLALGIAAERERMWLDALRAVGLDDRAVAREAAAAYGRARAGALELAPGAHALLAALRERGCKLGLVTNGFAETHHDKIDRLGLRDLIDAFFLADEVGMVKPDPELFRHACRTLGSAPARTAMVGDRYGRDVVGAHAAGLFTVLVDVHRHPVPPQGPRPDAVVASIGQVLAVLPLGPPRDTGGIGGNRPR
jgi:putative hydrolase of the HAD superfamily